MEKEIHYKPTIVVDLDDTLVHVTPVAPKDLDNNNSFTIIVKKMKFYVQMRPNLKYFIEKISKSFNICIFTSSEKVYATKIIEKILPDFKNCHCFFKDSCVNMCGYYVKDLELLKFPLNKILLIDDLAGSAIKNPKNLVKIKPWNGEKDDNVLNNLLTILDSIVDEEDLRLSFQETLKNGNYDGIGTF